MKLCTEDHVHKRQCKAHDWGNCHAPQTCMEVKNGNKSMEDEETYGKGESDPTGLGQHEHGCKTDAGKPDLSLLLMFGRALRAVGEVGSYGARKYTRGGWQGVDDGINRYTAALLRHLFVEHYEKFDTDLPVMHAAQVAWNALARLELMLREEDNDATDT